MVFAAIAVSVAVQAQSSQREVLAARQWRTPHEAEILQQFETLLSIPSVASDDANIRRYASSNENIRWQNLWDGIEIMAALMQME
jgi:hypothetical protein